MADVEHPQPRRGRTLASVAAPILVVAIVALLSSRGHGDRPPAPRPSATSAPIDELPIVSKSMVASDPRNGALLLVGCCDPGVSGSEPASTWERIGTGWTHLAPATAPPYHPGPGLAFDPATATFLLQGGDASSETWSWDGRDWTPLHPPASPPPGPAVMTYSSAGRVLALLTTTPGPDVETWSWDGRTWARVAAPAPPPPQGPFAVADDPVRRRLVVLVGAGCGLEGPSQMWTFDGRSWTSGSGPPCDPSTQLAWDPTSASVIALQLGDTANPIGFSSGPVVTWRQAADGWSRVPSSTAPAETGRLVSDGVTRPVFVSDGRTGGQPDLWVWDGAGWSPHPGGRGVQGR